MSSAAKPRADAKLKMLPFAQQEQVFSLCQTMSYAAVRSAVREKLGVDTSEAALSAFYRWYPTARRLEDAAGTADEVRQILRELPGLNLSDEQVSRAAQAAFEAQCLKSGDVESFIGLRKLRQKDRDQAQTDRRIALLEKKAAQADAAEGVVHDQALTEEQKAARLREIFRM